MIDDWKQAHRFFSIWATVGLGLLAGLEPHIPLLHGHFDRKWVMVAAVVIVAARLARQDKLHKTPPNEVFEAAKKAAKVSLFVLVIALLGGCGDDEPAKSPLDALTADERKCVLAEKKRVALEIAACGDNVEGVCATRSIYARSLETRLACVR